MSPGNLGGVLLGRRAGIGAGPAGGDLRFLRYKGWLGEVCLQGVLGYFQDLDCFSRRGGWAGLGWAWKTQLVLTRLFLPPVHGTERRRLLLLLVVGVCSVRSEGEACLGWAYGTEPWGEAFRCVKERDGEGSQFCCGTCALPYCCASEEDRLDQAQCASESRLGAATAASKRARKYKDSEIFGFIALALIVIVCCFYSCICCFRHRDRLPFFRPGNWSAGADPSIRLSVIDRRPDDGTHASTDAEEQQSDSTVPSNSDPPSYERCVNPALLGGGEQQGRSTVPWDNDPPPSYDELSVNPAFLGLEEQQSTTALLSAETPAVPLGQAGPAALESEETHLSPEGLQAGMVSVEPISETFV